ncbi:ubiquitin-associated protein 1-like isoform X1 [Lytechinus pictus]|uniref:ubiquitin-associated protein 1-like isoform X1 n=1 Tax=Lytechinus pictus TaxID=7653 RepID=UPI0030B9C33F
MVHNIVGNMAYGSQTLHRAYSVSSVEGIELRLSDRFKPTKKVVLPLQYKHKEPRPQKSEEEYDFQTENTFLEWLDGVRRTESEREEKRKQQQLGAEAAEAALQREETVPDGPHTTSNEFPMQTNLSQPPLRPPVAATLSNEILQPVPLANSISKPVNNQSARTDNWDDFEGRSLDPFELTELETINDMEELRSVLANSAPVATPAVQNNQLQTSSPPPVDVDMEEAVSSFTDAADLPASEESNQVQFETNFNQASFKPIPKDSKPELPAYQPTEQSKPPLPNRTIPSTSALPALPPLRNVSFASNSPLPPISPSRENSESSLSSGGVGPLPHDQGRMSPPPSYSSLTPTAVLSGSSPVNAAIDRPPNYPMDELEANFSPVNLSRYSPLPPASSQHVSTINTEPQDPTYEAMSVEEKNFVNTIVSMGFPKGRTARAVKNIGSDDRQVVDLLCAVDSLCGQGFPESKVEVALSLQDNNQDKAQTFLKLWQRFEVLGFQSEDIKRELILHGNDEEKVLDTLTR